MKKKYFIAVCIVILTLTTLCGSDMGGSNVASAKIASSGDEYLQMLEQYYMKIPQSTRAMPDTPDAMRQWYDGYKGIEREMQRLGSAAPQLSKAESLKAGIIHARIIAAKAGFNPSKSAAVVVENLSRNINLFRNCHDDLGIGYCKFNDMNAVRTIETSGKPLGYFFYPDEITSAKKLIRLIKRYNGIR